MKFSDYQESAKDTIQEYEVNESVKNVIPFLGISGEAGSVLSELKKHLRDGDSYTSFGKNLKQELGDVLWYISAIATQNGLSLEEIASENLTKIKDRFLEVDLMSIRDYDEDYPVTERFPDELEIEFKSYEEDGHKKMMILNNSTGEKIGDPLTDNTYEDDGYRFHDIFHYGYLAFLGWSPVLRKLLDKKRRSRPEIDENEDGARAAIIEEAISLYIYGHAKNHQLLKYSKSIDTEVLNTIKQLVSQIEVKDCTARQWEVVVLKSYEVFNKLKEYDGGRVLVSKKNRDLIYLGKN